jgi:hypothetical protein
VSARVVAAALGLALLAAPVAAQDESPLPRGSRTRGLIAGWGMGWRPLFGQSRSDVAFGAFHPRLGWFVLDRAELFGEATLFVYHRPSWEIAAGAGGLGGRYYFRETGPWLPYAYGGVGLLWTSLDVVEIDRVFNFQHFFGVGMRQNRPRGPRWLLEFRNHHISNAGTVEPNLGINAATVLTGVEWVLRPGT